MACYSRATIAFVVRAGRMSTSEKAAEFLPDALAFPELEVVGVTAVLVVVPDVAFDLEPEGLIEVERVAVGRPRVACHRGVVLCDPGDEPFPEPLSPVIVVDGEKEDVSVAADGGEPDEPVVGPVDVQVTLRAAIGAGKEVLALSENPLGAPDALLELPDSFHVVVAPRPDLLALDVDTHYPYLTSDG
jgi:hypothetical protein